MNLSHNFLLAFIYGIYQPTSVRAENEPFDVLTNVVEVEELLVAYAPIAHAKKKKILSPLMKKTNICNSSKDVKISFCQRSLRIDYHGFEFDLTNYRNPKCEDTAFVPQFVHVVSPNIKYNSLKMFKCPPIKFINIRTDRNNFTQFKHMIFVSRGEYRNSAFVFIQKNSQSPIRPFLFVSNIRFDKLTRYNEGELNLLNEETSRMERWTDIVEHRVALFLKNKSIIAPYKKFISQGKSLGVCGLRQSQKIYICRLAIQTYLGLSFNLDGDDYDEHRCRKHQVHLETEAKERAVKEYNLSVVRCPAMVSQNIDEEQNVKNPSSYYLSTNSTPASVTLFFRDNIRMQPLEVVCTLDKLNLLRIAQDNRRAKFVVYPSTSERATIQHRISVDAIVEEINASTTNVRTVQMPTTIARPENYDELEIKELAENADQLELRHSRRLVDDLLISFSTMKNNKSVYQKFRIFHRSIDVCQLSTKQRRNLCDNVMDHYGFRVETVFARRKAINYACKRQQIWLSLRDAENLKSDTFSLWQCLQPVSKDKHTFYIGKSHLRDAAFVYRVFEEGFFRHRIVVIDALASNIDRYLLALAEITI